MEASAYTQALTEHCQGEASGPTTLPHPVSVLRSKSSLVSAHRRTPRPRSSGGMATGCQNAFPWQMSQLTPRHIYTARQSINYYLNIYWDLRIREKTDYTNSSSVMNGSSGRRLQPDGAARMQDCITEYFKPGCKYSVCFS